MSNLKREEPELLYHVTPTVNLTSIGQAGLLPQYSRGRREAVWLVDRARVEWAILHVCRRHQRIAEEVTVLEVQPAARRLNRSGREGLWWTPCQVPPQLLSSAWSVEDWLDDMSPGEADFPDAPEGVQIGG